MWVLSIGAAGMLLILFAFLMNQIHRWDEDMLIYDFFNFLGGLLMSVYAFLINSWPFLVLNFVWMAYSLRDSVLDIKSKKKVRRHLPGHKGS